MKEIKINNKMYVLLVDNNIDNFTVAELHSQYLRLGLSKKDGKDRQFLYRQLFSLEDRGLLSKQGESYSRQMTYSKTVLFQSSTLLPKKGPYQPSLPEKELLSQLPPLATLKRELVQTYTRFALCRDESKEYKRLMIQYPSMTQYFKEHYQQSHENAFSLMAKINALKTFIQEYPSNDQPLS